jgi:hypothetical protein
MLAQLQAGNQHDAPRASGKIGCKALRACHPAGHGHSILPVGLPLSDTTKLYFNKWSDSLAKYHAGA